MSIREDMQNLNKIMRQFDNNGQVVVVSSIASRTLPEGIKQYILFVHEIVIIKNSIDMGVDMELNQYLATVNQDAIALVPVER